MKLYYAPLACSLADHIALAEAGLPFQVERVDLKTKMTASGKDYTAINAKGYVPALLLPDGEMITENVAVLYWIAKMSPSLGVSGALGDTRLLEALSFLATEVHTGFKPMWHGGTGEEKDAARARLTQRFAFVSERLKGAFIFGDTLSVADCYLYVMLLWADRFSVPVPQELRRLRRRIEVRPTVRAALEVEGIGDLAAPAAASALSSDVRENPALNRFERSIDDEAMALAFYRPENEKLIFTHTIVPPEFSGQGIGADLVRGTFDLLRISGRKAVLVCPFMAHFFRSHPEYSDVVEA